MPPKLLDLRAEQHPLLFPRKKDKDGKPINTSKTEWKRDELGKRYERTIVRDPKDITGVTVHQTACIFGPWNDKPKRYRRALKVTVPVVAFMDGTFVHSAPLLWYLYSSNALNPFSYAIEFEGHFSGLLDDPETPRREDEDTIWGGGTPTVLTPEMIGCYREALRYLVEEGRRLGSDLKWMWAHRQSSKDRLSDPGDALWGEVAEWGCRELGLKARYSDTFRDGRPIPKEWAPGGVGKYR